MRGTVKISGMCLHKKLDETIRMILHPDTIVTAGDRLTYRVEAVSSFPSDTIYYRFLKSPSWLQIDSSGLIHGVIAASPGDYNVTVLANGQHGDEDAESFNLHVSAEGQNPLRIVSFPDTSVAPDADVLLFAVCEVRLPW